MTIAPIFAGFGLVHAATPQEMIDAQVPAARSILDDWQQQNPEREQRKLHIVLWTPNDREPAPRYQERLSAILKDIQGFYAKEMQRLGFGPRTFSLDEQPDGQVKIHLVKGRGPYANYARQSGGEIRNECLMTLRKEGINPDDSTIVLFCNMSVWDAETRKITQNSPYYATGTHRHGTAWQVDSPILELGMLDKKEPRVSDGEYGDISIGRYNSIFIGGIAHELGHALGLPHNRERADEKDAFGTALMGSGNRTYGENLRGEGKGSFLTLAHGLRLASHPAFCGSVKGNGLKPNVVPRDLAVGKSEHGFVVTGTAQADPPVYGVVAYMDPAGNSDYNATTTSAVPDANGRFELKCEALEAGAVGELRLVFLQSNGVASGFLSNSPFRYSYAVARDGTADISAMQAQLQLNPVTDAVLGKNEDAAREALAVLTPSLEANLNSIATRLLRSMDGEPTEPLPMSGAQAWLADYQITKQSVGYGKLLRDRLPEKPLVLTSGGKLFTNGLYAHAPSSLTWDLTGKGWRKLTGRAGLPDGNGGSVEFIVKGDGNVIWQSGVVKEGIAKPFSIDVSKVNTLELETTDGGDGKASDWSLWLEPMLTRE